MPKLAACGDVRHTCASGSGWRQLVPSHRLCLHNTTARSHQPPALGQGSLGAADGGSFFWGAEHCWFSLLESCYLHVQGMGRRAERFCLLAAKTEVPSERCRLGPELFMASHAELQPFSSYGIGTVLYLSSKESKVPCKQLSLTIPQRAGEELSPHFYLSGK